jgi:uroporphyrinogen-III synthase
LILAGWALIPFYVVGGKTASALRDVFTSLDLGRVDIRGHESGNAANLATFILADLHGKAGAKLLYLTGDKNRDTVTRILEDNNIELELLQVYKTQGSLSFGSNLSLALESSPKGRVILVL